MTDYDIAELQSKVVALEERLKMLEIGLTYMLYDMEQHEAVHSTIDCMISNN